MKWLFFIIIFLAAMAFGFEMVQDPGYALFVYHGWMVQMPLWFALLLLLLLLFFVYFFTRLLCVFMFLKRSIRFWWLERCFHKKELKNKIK
ncbi:MAG: heme biosynthesis HemY N-terminal domain-containing protein [Pseudomonadota bacterium]